MPRQTTAVVLFQMVKHQVRAAYSAMADLDPVHYCHTGRAVPIFSLPNRCKLLSRCIVKLPYSYHELYCAVMHLIGAVYLGMAGLDPAHAHQAGQALSFWGGAREVWGASGWRGQQPWPSSACANRQHLQNPPLQTPKWGNALQQA